jgi:DNA-binding MarR family transcriptional regulator
MIAPDPTYEKLLHQTVECFWDTFPPLWDRIRGHLREIVAEDTELTVDQFHILRHIRQGAGSVSKLAEARQISRPAASQAVDLLVHKGLLTRQQSLQDRRCVELELTPGGMALINAAFEKNRAWMAIKLAALSPDELARLQEALSALQRTFVETGERA